MTYQLVPVPKSDLPATLSEVTRTSAGRVVVDAFLETTEVAVTIDGGSVKARNSLLVSISNYVRSRSLNVWVRRVYPQGILLVALDRADDETKTAYETRPRLGRKPGGKNVAKSNAAVKSNGAAKAKRAAKSTPTSAAAG